MKYSKKWLQSYIKETLPEDSVISNELNARAFEVEEIDILGDDTVFDIKVLPNRHGDALSHYYMAREICALLNLTPLMYEREEVEFNGGLNITISDFKKCSAFASVRISGVSPIESPEWLKKSLNNIGQKSINAIVDVTNYVQFAINKPLHAYDASVIDGGFVVRNALAGEVLPLLTKEELKLDGTTLVIADNSKPLGLAGIKGGLSSGVSSATSEILLESAIFDPVLIRKTSQKYNLRTDASKRFEAGQSDFLVKEGVYMAIALYRKIFGNIDVSDATICGNISSWKYKVGVTKDEINKSLGADLNTETVLEILNNGGVKSETVAPKDILEQTINLLVGKPYKSFSVMRKDAPESFSCSSFVSYVFLQAGVYMPSLVIDKFVYAQKIETSAVKAFDVIFANGTGWFEYMSDDGDVLKSDEKFKVSDGRVKRTSTIEFMRGTKVDVEVDHIGIIMPDGKIAHAGKKEGGVVMVSLEEFLKERTLVSYGRFCDADEERILSYIPEVRVDLRKPEDILEEVGRWYGYKNLIGVLPGIQPVNKVSNLISNANIIKNILVKHGLTEVMTSSFRNSGDINILKGLADDKSALRTSISDELVESYKRNFSFMPLLAIDKIAIFEIGSVFKSDGEYKHLSILIDDGKKKTSYTETVDLLLAEIKQALKLDTLEYQIINNKPCTVEVVLGKVNGIAEDVDSVNLDFRDEHKKFSHLSMYPIVVRDVSFYLGESVSVEDVVAISSRYAKGLCKKSYVADEFKKTLDDGTESHSMTLRFVYQSDERTLTDDEVNNEVAPVYEEFKSLGCILR